MERRDAPIKVVQLDGLVLLKMINHCRDSLPDIVSGQLLGLDTPPTLSITACFPLPSQLTASAEDSYQLDMMKMLRTVNVDNNTVGWYQSSHINSLYDATVVEAQYGYQKQIPNSVVILYEPVTTRSGRCTVHAYRLTDSFMSIYDKGQITQDLLTKAEIESNGIFQEIPIKVHNSHLVHGFLYELREQKNMNCDSERLTISHTSTLDHHLTLLSQSIDDYTSEQGKYQFYQRTLARQKQSQQSYLAKRQSDNEVRIMQGQQPTEEDVSKLQLFKPIPKPSRLETYLIGASIRHLSRSVERSVGGTMQKLSVIEGVHKGEGKNSTGTTTNNNDSQ